MVAAVLMTPKRRLISLKISWVFPLVVCLLSGLCAAVGLALGEAPGSSAEIMLAAISGYAAGVTIRILV
jgi:hypothetical protein